MGVAAIIFIIITILAIDDGSDMTVTVLFGGLAVLFIYLWATKDARKKKQAENAQKQREEKERQRIAEVQQSACARFNASPFATQLRQDFAQRGWQDLDYNNGKGCQIYADKIETPCRTYVYIDYGLGKLDMQSCEELAEYLGLASGREYVTRKLEKFVGGRSSSYSGYVDSNGHVSISQDADGHDVTIGYSVYIKSTIPPQKPQGKAW